MATAERRHTEFPAVDGFASLVNTLLDGSERLLSHNLQTARGVLAELAERGEAMATSDRLPAGVGFAAAWVQPVPERMLAYWRRCYEISADTQEELLRRMGGQYSLLCNSALSSFLSEMGSTSPLASDLAARVAGDVSQASDRLLDAALLAVEPVAQMVEAGIAAVADATARAAAGAASSSDASGCALAQDSPRRAK